MSISIQDLTHKFFAKKSCSKLVEKPKSGSPFNIRHLDTTDFPGPFSVNIGNVRMNYSYFSVKHTRFNPSKPAPPAKVMPKNNTSTGKFR